MEILATTFTNQTREINVFIDIGTHLFPQTVEGSKEFNVFQIIYISKYFLKKKKLTVLNR